MHLKFAEALNQILIKMKIIVETFRNPETPESLLLARCGYVLWLGNLRRLIASGVHKL